MDCRIWKMKLLSMSFNLHSIDWPPGGGCLSKHVNAFHSCSGCDASLNICICQVRSVSPRRRGWALGALVFVAVHDAVHVSSFWNGGAKDTADCRSTRRRRLRNCMSKLAAVNILIIFGLFITQELQQLPQIADENLLRLIFCREFNQQMIFIYVWTETGASWCS